MLGTNRGIDNLGRVCIPIEMRRKLNITEDDKLDISCDGSAITIMKNDASCAFCSSQTDLIELNGKHICISCVEKLGAIRKKS